MKMDRNVNKNGHGKYALINVRKLDQLLDPKNDQFGRLGNELRTSLDILDKRGILEYGAPHSEDEFFVVKLRDEFSTGALVGYANQIKQHDREFADEVLEMANRSGINNPHCKKPD